MVVYGAVIVKGVEYADDEMCNINPEQRLLYGIDWKYAGDQGWEESNIYVSDELIYDGRKGLNQFLSDYTAGKVVL